MKTYLLLKRGAGRITLSIILLFLSLYEINAQAPPNDNCSGAIQLNVDAPYISGTTAGATPGPAVTCTTDYGAPGGTANDDVWYKFTATKPYLVIAVAGSAQFNAVIQLFSGSCGNLTIMDCANEAGNGQVEKLPLNYYVPGETYYFRVFTQGPGAPATPGFQVRVYTAIPPSNDECANAKPVPVRDHCQDQTENDEGATRSPEPSSCADGAARNDDMWYSFVALTNRVVILVKASHNYRAVLEVFDKCDGTAMACTTSVKHDMAVKLAFDDLIPGHKYIFRVYNYYTPLSKSETFQLCVYDPPIPSNDECAGATALTADDSIHDDLNGATPSQGIAPPCSGTPNDDVWYKFKATSTQETITLIPSPYFDGVIQVFDACKGNVVGCVNKGGRHVTEVLTLTGLTVGKDYFVRIFTFEAVVSVTTDFSIIMKSGPKPPPPPPPPANDECANAINIPVSLKGVESVNGTFANATQSMPSCTDSTSLANDVWYKFTAIESSVKIDVTPKTSDVDIVLSILDSCAGKMLACVDNGGNGDPEEWNGTNLIKNHTYFIRVFDANGSNPKGAFTVSIDGLQVVQSVSNAIESFLKVYPIPVQDVLQINSDGKLQNGNIILTDLQGNVMFNENGSIQNSYDISKYAPGTYILKIISEDKVYTIKVIKK